MSVRSALTLHHEARFGLARGAVYKNGQPQLYLEGYEHDPSLAVFGTRSVARLRTNSGGVRFLTLADGAEGVLDAPADAKLTEGMAVEVDVVAEARPSKLARARFIATAEGDARRLSPVLSLKDRLLARTQAIFGAADVREGNDRAALDQARDEALAVSGPLAGGGDLSIEATRGLIGCDVDAAGEGGVQTARAFAKGCNERAVADLPRRLRLAGLGGLVVVDLIGQRHDGEKLRRLLLEGFAGEASQIIVAPIGRFGTLEFTRPWSTSPVRHYVEPEHVAISALWQALDLSDADRSRPIIVRCPGAALDILKRGIIGSFDPLAPMLRLEEAKFVKVDYA